MKKMITALCILLLVAGCTTGGFDLVYMASDAGSAPAPAVYLAAKDNRADKMVVTDAVHKAGLFKDIGSFVSFTARRPDGGTASFPNVDVEQVFFEAFKARLKAMGVQLLNEPTPGQPSLVIEVETFRLDMNEGRKLEARVAYLARIETKTGVIRKERLTGSYEEFYISGQNTGEKILSSAFTSAVNRFNLEQLAR